MADEALADLNADEAKDRVGKAQHNSLDRLEEEEKAGKNRDGVLKAIAARREHFENPDGDQQGAGSGGSQGSQGGQQASQQSRSSNAGASGTASQRTQETPSASSATAGTSDQKDAEAAKDAGDQSAPRGDFAGAILNPGDEHKESLEAAEDDPDGASAVDAAEITNVADQIDKKTHMARGPDGRLQQVGQVFTNF
jgi:hypothetical protein